MKPSANLIFFGNERLSTSFQPHGAPTLQALIDAGYNVVAVVANYERGNSRNARELEIEEVARHHNIPVLLPEKLSDIKDQLVQLNPTVGVLVAYGKMVPQSIIDIFPKGILNIHPSLLPEKRGSTPIETAILDGSTKTGVSIMQLVKAMDAGPIFTQEQVALTGQETKQQLSEELLSLGGKLLLKVLPGVIAGTAEPREQDESKATFTNLIKKSDARLEPSNKSAQQLEREIRAFAGWPKSNLDLFDQTIIVTSARIADNQNDGALVITCADDSCLEIQSLIGPSGRQMSGADFIRGYKKS